MLNFPKAKRKNENQEMTASEWLKIPCKRDFLDISVILQIGQSFRWIYNPISNEYLSSVNLNHADEFEVVKLKQDDTHIYYQLLSSIKRENGNIMLSDLSKSPAITKWVEKYFRLELDREKLFQHWAIVDSKNHASFSKLKANCCVLNQDPWETLISFICSSNNNISRITRMCHKLTELGGQKLEHDDPDNILYSFPTSFEIISRITDGMLREHGFGYRSKYIMDTAKLLQDLKEQEKKSHISDSLFLYDKIHSKPYLEAREFLLNFPGVGPKVADCVLLMGGFGFDEVVPVDVHVKRIAERDYKLGSKTQTKAALNKLKTEYAIYTNTKKKINYEMDIIRTQLVEMWGPYAGWAQALLFTKEVGSTSGKVGDVISKRKIDVVDKDTQPTKKKRKT